MLTDPQEAGRRVRAARAYANLSRHELAAATGLTLKQVRDLEEGTRTVTTLAELDAIAIACDTPREFLRLGWTGGGDLFERIWQLLALRARGGPGGAAGAQERGSPYTWASTCATWTAAEWGGRPSGP